MDIEKSELVEIVVNYAVSALLEEVKAHPKFGLVTSKSQGKHTDMNYETFEKSIFAIKPFLYEYANEGFEIDEESFPRLRIIGLRAERAMFEATNQINTHKGIIFLFGYLLPSIVDAIYNQKEYYEISENVKFLGQDLLKDFENIETKQELTYGEKVFVEYGITGIRGVVFDGIKIAFDIAEKFEYIESDINELVINILVNCMMSLDDTVILHKKDIETLDYVKQRSEKIIELGGFSSEQGKKEIYDFTDECIEMGISPGGSADLVSVILILLKIRQKFF